MARLAAAFGADPRTAAGLAGMGDLIATCTSKHSRNRAAGALLARGVPAAALEAEIGMVVEGATTAATLQRSAASRGVEVPITDAICAVLAGLPVRAALPLLLEREPGDE